MTFRHEELVTFARNTAAAYAVHAEALREAGVDADAVLARLARLVFDEEASEDDGCLRRLWPHGNWPFPEPSPPAGRPSPVPDAPFFPSAPRLASPDGGSIFSGSPLRPSLRR